MLMAGYDIEISVENCIEAQAMQEILIIPR